jgi:hypothetical protein
MALSSLGPPTSNGRLALRPPAAHRQSLSISHWSMLCGRAALLHGTPRYSSLL